jgi:3D (Asp-Asp-Asp) domain-containing protein
MLSLKKLTVLFICIILLSSCYPFASKKTSGKEEKVYMEVTAYCDCGECCAYYRSCLTCWLIPYYKKGPSKGKKKDIGITSDGSKAKRGTIAADISLYPYGTKMYVPGYGWGEVHDTGSAIKGNRIDLFFSSHEKADKWGRQKLWVTIIRE